MVLGKYLFVGYLILRDRVREGCCKASVLLYMAVQTKAHTGVP